MMKDWLRALRSETLLCWWMILSAVSTISTFFVPSWSGRLRALFSISAIAAFGWANFRVFQKQQIQIRQLTEQLLSHESRTTQLEIYEQSGSRFILFPIQNVTRGDFRGGFFEFYLMIENRGRRNSTVIEYQVEIVELNRTFANLRPVEHQNGAQGRHSHFGLNRDQILSNTGNIEIAAEAMTNRGTLIFRIPDITLDQFIEAGLRMEGEEHRFGSLHCRLTLMDNTHASASHEFTLREA